MYDFLLLGLLQFVFFVRPGTDVVVKTGTDAEKVTLNPETGRYSEVVVILTELCVKITWMQVFPFWLRATIPYCISRDGWLTYGDIMKANG